MADLGLETGESLGFRVSGPKVGALPAETVGEPSEIVVEARGLGGHLKEALIAEGPSGAQWRLLCDEGKHLKGTDSAPFPLGFFNAGLQGDLLRRILATATRRGIDLRDVSLSLRNFYALTGSFARGDGEGFAEPAEIVLRARTSKPQDALLSLLREAAPLSPAIDAMRRPLVNTFALYVNGRRRTLTGMKEATGGDAEDPFLVHRSAPVPDPGAPAPPTPVIAKTGVVEPGDLQPAPVSTTGRLLRTVAGLGRLHDPRGFAEIDTWLELPGVSHFSIATDERTAGHAAPTGLTHLAAGIAFCFMTQLSRYIEHLKLDIGDLRLVQRTPFALRQGPDGPQGEALPVETHLFLNGRAEPKVHERLMLVAARTCYLHATLAAALPPRLSVERLAA